MRGLAGKGVVVTGGAGGIGKAASKRFIEEGARVVIADVDEEAGRATADELGDAATFSRCDVTSVDDLMATFALAQETHGSFDVLVNNAAVEHWGAMPEMDEDKFRQVIEVDLTAVFLGIKYATPLLTASGGGAIVNTSSAAGVNGIPIMGAYCGAKAGVINMSNVAALELRDAGIRVNCVCPGFVKTQMIDRILPTFEAMLGMPIDDYIPPKQGRWGKPEDIGDVIVFLASDDARFISGESILVDNALSSSLF